MLYDIIGDIHGCSETLKALLQKLGYKLVAGVYRHPDRRAVFLGDFIDRGPHQREVIEIVRPMIEQGEALSVMGNHEFNAIAYSTRDPNTGWWLRDRSDKNRNQHRAFLDAFPVDSQEYTDTVSWFSTLPLWLDLPGIRVVHACWDPVAIEYLSGRMNVSKLLNPDLLVAASTEGSREYEAVETILKGKEIPLPDGFSFEDKDGNHRHHIRIRWWDRSAKTYQDAFLGPAGAVTHIPEDPIDQDHLITYKKTDPPVFLGHYWLEGAPKPLTPNIACLDYSVAKPGGKLVAYRWDGEEEVDSRKFVAVGAID